ncbi:MAG: GIY-YIG nuclease family protein, partial [Planctomycetota bacterium]
MKKAKKRPPLVQGLLEQVSSKVFWKFSDQITDLVKKRHGVYALYKGNRLYYVGLATNLRNRVKSHLRDKHAGKWDKFSIYLVRHEDHIKELESLILRIAVPKGNATKGRLAHAEDLRKKLRCQIRIIQHEQISDIMGRKE